MPTPTRAKPPIPAWVIRERKRLGLKPRDLADRLSAMGLPVTEGTVRTWEAGRNPHPDNVEGLERIFGTRSPDFMAEAHGGDTAGVSALLLEALARQAEAMTAQTAVLTRLALAVEALVSSRGEPDGGDGQEIADLRRRVREVELQPGDTPLRLPRRPRTRHAAGSRTDPRETEPSAPGR